MRALKALLGGALWIIVLVILPRAMLKDLPPEFLAPYGSAEVVINFLTVIGLIIATLYVAKALTPKSNPVNLVASIGSDLARFYSFLFFIGFGDPTSFGRVEKTISAGGDMTFISDFGIFVQLLLVLLIIDFAVAFLEFYNSKSQNAAGASGNA